MLSIMLMENKFIYTEYSIKGFRLLIFKKLQLIKPILCLIKVFFNYNSFFKSACLSFVPILLNKLFNLFYLSFDCLCIALTAELIELFTLFLDHSVQKSIVILSGLILGVSTIIFTGSKDESPITIAQVNLQSY
jgi:hypothetical protein